MKFWQRNNVSINEWDNGIHKLYALERSFDNIKSNDEIENAQLSLFLVGIITCIELATRNAIQRLVDKGTPFIERIDKFKDFLKIDLNVTCGAVIQKTRTAKSDV